MPLKASDSSSRCFWYAAAASIATCCDFLSLASFAASAVATACAFSSLPIQHYVSNHCTKQKKRVTYCAQLLRRSGNRCLHPIQPASDLFHRWPDSPKAQQLPSHLAHDLCLWRPGSQLLYWDTCPTHDLRRQAQAQTDCCRMLSHSPAD